MTLEAIGPLVHAAIGERVFPGAVVLIAHGGTVLHHAAYGHQTYDPAAPPVAPDTVYDLASLTKLFTAAAALRLVDGGALRLDAPAALYLPELRAADVTVTQLLTHTSGLDVRLSALRDRTPPALAEAVFAAPQRHPPGVVVAYSNINTLLLGWIVERLTAQTLDQAIDALVSAPLGLTRTRFCPPPEWWPAIPPTEIDASWRGGVVQGRVHDESAYALGGVAGHAGLFGSAADLLRFAAAWHAALNGDETWLSPALARAAVRNWTAPAGTSPPRQGMPPETAPQRREDAKGAKDLEAPHEAPVTRTACGLGWMRDRANFMGPAPQGSVGHTGFTGPALVLVPATGHTIVILSNRTYPQRTPAAHHAVTAQLVDLVLHAS